MHSVLKLEKNAISKMAKNKFLHQKKFKSNKNLVSLCQSEKKSIFGSFKLFSGAKMDFWPFLKIMQIMFFCALLKLHFFSNFKAHCEMSNFKSDSS